MRRTTIIIAMLGVMGGCSGRRNKSAQETIAAAVSRDSAGRRLTRVDSLASRAFPGGWLYVGDLEPKSAHTISSVVAFRDRDYGPTVIGHRRLSPDSWPVWSDHVTTDRFLDACEEIVDYFVLGEAN